MLRFRKIFLIIFVLVLVFSAVPIYAETVPYDESTNGGIILLFSDPDPEVIPSLPFTGGLFETELIMLGFGAASILTGLVINGKMRRK